MPSTFCPDNDAESLALPARTCQIGFQRPDRRRYGMHGGEIINPRWEAGEGESNPYLLQSGMSLFPTSLHFLHCEAGFADLRALLDFLGISAPIIESAVLGFVEVELPEGYCMDPNGFFIGDHSHGTPMRPACGGMAIPGMDMQWMSGLNFGYEHKLRQWIRISREGLPAWLRWKNTILVS